jgi:hypothetical protein
VAAFLPKGGQSLLDLTKLPEGADEQVLASQCGRRRRASGRRHAGSGFASRVVRILHEGRCGVGDRTAVPATSLARLRVFGSEATDYRIAPERRAMQK